MRTVGARHIGDVDLVVHEWIGGDGAERGGLGALVLLAGHWLRLPLHLGRRVLSDFRACVDQGVAWAARRRGLPEAPRTIGVARRALTERRAIRIGDAAEGVLP